jgi:ribonucleoside-diphosphate reductase alpha chain
MNSVVKLEHKDVDAIPFQEASLDIWDKKYRLSAKDGTPVDKTMDDTYKRVARALADVEQEPVREHWYERFLWALRRGAIPAGRVTSNAGALEHKPATSTINCTVSGTIRDSMDDILNKVHEAGLTLKAGCGIGYEFSTLRPRGAYVSGAGAYTSGPLSFMDIYDKMCFTVSSAGGRRGAQMGTFDVGHPDVMEFIRAKRENGRLRQFNLSLLVTDEFMKAVREDKDWNLAFPLLTKEYDPATHQLTDTSKFVWREWPSTQGYVTREDGLVCCKIYKTLPARRMWDVIMSSTYDFAEPGFILIDKVNEMNNNWWCENIRATNPCVTADTWVQTREGPRQVAELIGKQFHARVDGVDHASAPEGFFRTALKPLVSLVTAEGHSLRLRPIIGCAASPCSPGSGCRPSGARLANCSPATRCCCRTIVVRRVGRGTESPAIGAATRVTSWGCSWAMACSPRIAPSSPSGPAPRWATATSTSVVRTR